MKGDKENEKKTQISVSYVEYSSSWNITFCVWTRGPNQHQHQHQLEGEQPGEATEETKDFSVKMVTDTGGVD
ncbi:hypothetical protein KHA80_05690 [Anaerobacillus sp. HL2]|nr:hypothetical protein KHA80_05690 [Anaerobacillus sp. HL2]